MSCLVEEADGICSSWEKSTLGLKLHAPSGRLCTRKREKNKEKTASFAVRSDLGHPRIPSSLQTCGRSRLSLTDLVVSRRVLAVAYSGRCSSGLNLKRQKYWCAKPR